MVDPGSLVGALAEAGWTEYSGVPCSILEPIRAEVERGASTRYLPASVEGEAVAIGAGLWLGGRGTVVLMQNSGLGNVVNPLASLLLPYRIPVLLVVSWRGQPGVADAVHHAPMGAITPGLLDLLSVPYWILDGSLPAGEIVAAALREMEARRTPAALVVPRGAVAGPSRAVDGASDGREADPGEEGCRSFGSGDPPDRARLVEAVVAHFPEDPIVSTTGYMSRDLAAVGPRDHHFYMQGSMGFAPAIALGVSRACPGRRVVVLDGDGALIMRLGTLATVGYAAPAGFVHIVADNGCYASTGGQRTAAANTSFPRVARAPVPAPPR
ncbi:MAG TPA: thiamine pyrophosphate-dependent enzyme, partial [Longimicrobiaceae bacterium]|nr:thiamine pyrophosphate-dependent enzyme [Longimicrobiaceae bacterium]